MIIRLLLLTLTTRIIAQEAISSMIPVSRDVFNAMIQLYQYNFATPLDVKLGKLKKFPQANRYKIVFKGIY